MPAWLVLIRSVFLACRWALSHCVLTWYVQGWGVRGEGGGEGGRERGMGGVGETENKHSDVSLLIKTLITSWGPHPHDLL